MGGITNETVHLSFDVDWSKEVNPLLYSYRAIYVISNHLMLAEDFLDIFSN